MKNVGLLRLFLAFVFGTVPGLVSAKPVVVVIKKVACASPCRNEGIEGAGESAPDFYAKVFINGVEQRLPSWPEDQDVVTEMRVATQEVPDTIVDVPVTIQIWDRDGTVFGGDDDLADASPVAGKANLDLVFHRNTGTVTGDVGYPVGCTTGNGEPGGGIFGADPQHPVTVCFEITGDNDGDGLLDSWENGGIDTNGDGTPDIVLPGADPNHKDIYVWIDYMDCAVMGSDCPGGDTHNHRPKEAAINAVVQAFTNAPVTNPDGTTGINLHLEIHNAISHSMLAAMPGGCGAGFPAGAANFDTLKDANFGINNPAHFAYHYCIFAHFGATPDDAGCSETPGNDMLLSFGGMYLDGPPDVDGDGISDVNVGTVMDQASTIMHELGHNLGLDHGGFEEANYKPNYVSVMNYFYDDGIPLPPTAPRLPPQITGLLDYSRGTRQPLEETNLDESVGVGDPSVNISYFCPGLLNCPSAKTTNGGGNIDWNCDGSANGVVVANIDGSFNDPNCEQATFTKLRDNDDWSMLLYDFKTTRSFRDAFHPDTPSEPEPTFFLRSTVLASELMISQTASPNPVLTGSNITYTITVANTGPGAASIVTVTDNLPSSLSFVSCASSGAGVCAGSANNRSVTFSFIAGGNSETITLVANVECSLPDATLITNTASVSTTSPERNTNNNTAAVTVYAANPPPVISNVLVSKPVIQPSPNHILVTETVDYSVTDNCGPISSLLSVTSNEPINGLGDGDQSPDWVILDPHHVQLRAERSGTGKGRTYTIRITVSDSAGNATGTTVTVKVPLSQTKK
jgi:uncharacterized repeat protein (TIGR01451 family)